MNANTIDVDALAQEIRRVDGDHSLGAGALAEALAPYIRALSADRGEAVLRRFVEGLDCECDPDYSSRTCARCLALATPPSPAESAAPSGVSVKAAMMSAHAHLPDSVLGHPARMQWLGEEFMRRMGIAQPQPGRVEGME